MDTAENRLYVGVYILDALYHMDKIYDYYITDEMREQANIEIGCFVVVPFGGGNKKKTGVIWTVKNSTEAKMTKPVSEFLSGGVALDEEQIALAEFIKDTAFCTIGDAVKILLPAGLRRDIFYTYRINAENSDSFEKVNPKNVFVLSFIAERERTLRELETEFGEEIKYVLRTLKKEGYITEETNVNETVKEKTEKFVVFDKKFSDYTYLEENVKNISPQAFEVIEYLRNNGDSSVDDILSYLNISVSAIKTLEKKGVLEIIDRQTDRDEYTSVFDSGEKISNSGFELNETQEKAYEKLSMMYREKRPCAALLHGVTGSGKTHVMLKLIEDVIIKGEKVIYLVPEISLIPQIYSYLENIYGGGVKILHSALSKGERFDTWNKIIKNQVNIIVGTRSAIFAPLTNLGLIVIDEEHEHTYKSEQTPHYHVRDIARFKCARSGAMMLLSSATPLVESYYRAKTGKYELIQLDSRFGVSELPQMELVDMRFEEADDKISYVSRRLAEEIGNCLYKKEQAIIYQNRRGYNHFLSCRSCGEVVMCPKCSIALKLHAYEKNMYGVSGRRSPSRLVCHFCGYTLAPLPKNCPSCDSEHMLAMGTGTQKCEDDIEEMFPNARIVRMDADTTSKKNSHQTIIKTMRENEADILIGTQMVTKGHNFNNVTLVGVLNADQSLYMEDYRANEKTFSMIAQVAGRAGRAEKEGRAIIQTYNAQNDILQICVKNDYESLYNKEIRLRKAAVFPPFCDICVLFLSSVDETQIETAAKHVNAEIRRMRETDFKDVALEIFGPFQALVYKINNNFKLRFVIKCVLNKITRQFLSELLVNFNKKLPKKISVSIDVNPNMI